MLESMTHIAWDRGAVTDGTLIRNVLGISPPTAKTCKAQCGRRVPMSAIDNRGANCESCRSVIVRDAQSMLDAFASFVSTLSGTDLAQVETAISHCRADVANFS